MMRLKWVRVCEVANEQKNYNENVWPWQMLHYSIYVLMFMKLNNISFIEQNSIISYTSDINQKQEESARERALCQLTECF